MTLQELREAIEAIDVTYDYDETYSNLYNTVVDYMNDSQDFSLESEFDDFIDYDLAEQLAKQALEEDGLIRLYYFMGDCNFNNTLFRIDGYGNLADVDRDDLQSLKESILDAIDMELDNE